MPVIETHDLCKRYDSRLVVDHLNLRIEAGTVFGLLGPNGSGKTTTILMIMGLTDITSGRVSVLGLDPTRKPLEVKRRVSYMPDTVGFYEHLTARQNLRFIGRLAGLEDSVIENRIASVLERVDLSDAADDPVATFSRGMRQRLGIADVLFTQPQVAILDEPTNGLDPQATHELLNLIRTLKSEGMTILLSSHLLERVEATCDRVGLFHRGRMVLEGTVHELAQRVLGAGVRIKVEARGRNLDRILASVPDVIGAEQASDGHYLLRATRDVRSDAVAAISREGGEILGLAIEEPNLNEIYNSYFEEARDAA